MCATVSLVSAGAPRHGPALPAWRLTPGLFCVAPACAFGGLSANQRRQNKILSSCVDNKSPSYSRQFHRFCMYSVVRAAAQRAPLHSSCVSSCVRSLPRRSPSSPQIAQPQNVHGGTSPFATLAGSPAAGSPGDKPQSTSYPRRQQRSPRRDNDSLEAIRACGSDWRKAVELLDALKGEGKATPRLAASKLHCSI